jgi:hypothetical protein
MAGKYIDFDAAIAESEERPVVVRYLARDWELYPSMPAKPAFRLLRLQAEGLGEAQLGRAEMLAFMAEMVPGEVLDAWLDGGLTIEQLGRLLRLVFDVYQGDAEAGAEGEAEGPQTGPTPSSSTGSR